MVNKTKNKMKKIKRVTRDGIEYLFNERNLLWEKDQTLEWKQEKVSEEVILNCPLFKVEYKSKKWRAENHIGYYYNNCYGNVRMKIEEFDDIDNQRYKMGNYFMTRKEATMSHLKEKGRTGLLNAKLENEA